MILEKIIITRKNTQFKKNKHQKKLNFETHECC